MRLQTQTASAHPGGCTLVIDVFRGVPQIVLALLAAGCGRVDFDELVDALSGPSIPITHAQVVVAMETSNGAAEHTFAATAAVAGDLVVIHTYCGSVDALVDVTITAPGWTMVDVGGVDSAQLHAHTIAAIAPDTKPATFDVAWTTSACVDTDDLGDELAGPVFTLPESIDDHVESSGTGDCTGNMTTHHAGDAVWAGCTSFSVTSPQPGFTLGADDQHGDLSLYALTTDPAGTLEMPGFVNSGPMPYVETAVLVTGR